MKNITIVVSGQQKIISINKLHGDYGPFCIDEKRIDQLVDIVLISDGTSSEFLESGSGTSKTSTNSLVGRSLVGGLLFGGVGAIIGAGSAERNENYESKTTEKKNFDFSVKLTWKNGSSVIAKIDNPIDLRWLASFVGQPEMSERDIEEERLSFQKSQDDSARLKKIKSEVNSELPLIYTKDQPSSIAIGSIVSIFLIAFAAGLISNGLFTGIWWGIKYGFIGLILVGVADGLVSGVHNKKAHERDLARRILLDRKMKTSSNAERAKSDVGP